MVDFYERGCHFHKIIEERGLDPEIYAAVEKSCNTLWNSWHEEGFGKMHHEFREEIIGIYTACDVRLKEKGENRTIPPVVNAALSLIDNPKGDNYVFYEYIMGKVRDQGGKFVKIQTPDGKFHNRIHGKLGGKFLTFPEAFTWTTLIALDASIPVRGHKEYQYIKDVNIFPSIAIMAEEQFEILENRWITFV